MLTSSKQPADFRTGYKVVKRMGETDRAGFGSITTYGRRMVYRIQEAATPVNECGPFAVFDDLEKARDWADGLWLNNWTTANGDSVVMVVEIEYTKADQHALWRPRPRGPRPEWYYGADEILPLPQGMHYLPDGGVIMRSNFPPGTKFASWLMIKRVVPRGE